MSSDTLHRGPRRSDDPFGRTASAVTGVLQLAAFWLAVVLPLVYLPLIALGLATSHPLWFVALLGTNALALVVGHAHEQPS